MNLDTARPLYKQAKQLSELATPEWSRAYDPATQVVEICTADAMTGEILPIGTIREDCPPDDAELMVKAPQLIMALLVLLQESFDQIRRLQPKPEKKPDYAAECAMMCNRGDFRKYLIDCHGMEAAGDIERVNSRVRSILKIKSRGELNSDPAAAARWVKLRKNFNAWRANA